MTSVFKFKQFELDQTDCGMKISTDGIAFGSWVDATGARRILDVGAGSGLLSLMLAQRFPHAQIDAIEIEPTAAQRARENFANSPWSDRLTLIEGDFKEYKSTENYDLIVSNPPYYSTTHNYSSSRRKLARNSNSLSPGDLVKGAQRLSANGTLSVIIPARLEDEFKEICHANSFEKVIDSTELVSIAGKPANRVMLAVSPKGQSQAGERNSLVIYDENSAYTEQFLKKTEAFYL